MGERWACVVALIWSALFLAGPLTRSARGDEGSYALEFLTVGVGARALSMGGATVAIAEDATAAYWNPAGLTGVATRGFAAERADMFQSGGGFALSRGLVQYSFLNVVLPFEEQAKLAFSWIRLGVDDIPRVTFEDVNGDGVLGTYRDLNLNGKKDPGEYYIDRPIVAETFSNTDDALLISYARPIGQNLAIGGSLKLIRQSLYIHRGTGFGVDLGARYRIGRALRLGFVVQDAVGTRVRWNTSTRPTFIRKATARVGVGVVLPIRRFATVTLASDVDLNRTTRRSEEDGASRLHAGAEISLLRTVRFRMGLDAGTFTAGAGFRIPVSGIEFQSDYAFMTHPDLGDAQRLSLTGAF